MTPEYYAKEAHRLLGDDVLLEAFDRAKTDAFEALVRVPAENTPEVIRLQMKIRALDEILDQLESMVARVGANSEPTSSIFA